MKSSYRYDLPCNNFLLMLSAVFIWEVNTRQCFSVYLETLHSIIPSSTVLQD